MISAGWLSMVVEWICWLPNWLAILEMLVMLSGHICWLWYLRGYDVYADWLVMIAKLEILAGHIHCSPVWL
jgi:hypothetical protein